MADKFDDEFDDIGGDWGDDWDIDPGGAPKPGDRTPTQEASATLMSSFKGLAAGSAKGLQNEVGLHFPRTVSHAEEAISIASDMNSMRREFMSDIEPTINQLKSVGDRLLPRAEKVIPKKLYGKLKEKLKTDPVSGPRSKEDLLNESRMMQTNSAIADIFNQSAIAQVESDETKRKQEIVDSVIDRKFKGAIHKDQMSVLSDTRNAVMTMHNQLLGPTVGYQKHDLMLKYQHLYVARDTLAVLKAMAKIQEIKLEEIKHNTALPDIQKQRKMESLKEFWRQRTAATFADHVTNFAPKMMANMKERVFDTAKMQLSQAATAGDMLASGLEDAEAMGIDLSDGKSKGQQGGGAAGKWLGTRMAEMLGRERLEKLAPYINDTENFTGNLKTRGILKIEELRRTKGSSGVLGKILDLMPEFNNTTNVGNDLLDEGASSTVFDHATRQSIVEIIPGYLAKILKQMTDLATGQSNEELIYDIRKRDFVGMSDARTALGELAFGKAENRGTDANLAVGVLRGAYTFNSEEGDNLVDFDQYLSEFKRVILNHAFHTLMLDPPKIRAFAQGGQSREESSTYIQKVFEKVTDPVKVANFIVQAIYNGEAVDKRSVATIDNSIIAEMNQDVYRSKLADVLETHGYRRLAGDMIDELNNVKSDATVDIMMDGNKEDFYKTLNDESQRFSTMVKDNDAIRSQHADYLREKIDKFGQYNFTDTAVKGLNTARGFIKSRMAPFQRKFEGIDVDLNVARDAAVEKARHAMATASDYIPTTGTMQSQLSELVKNTKSTATGVRDRVNTSAADLRNRVDESEISDRLKDTFSEENLASAQQSFESKRSDFAAKMSPYKEDIIAKIEEISQPLKDATDTSKITEKLDESVQASVRLSTTVSESIDEMKEAFIENAGAQAPVFDLPDEFSNFIDAQMVHNDQMNEHMENVLLGISIVGDRIYEVGSGGGVSEGGGPIPGAGPKGPGFAKRASGMAGRGLKGLGRGYANMISGFYRGAGSAIGGGFNLASSLVPAAATMGSSVISGGLGLASSTMGMYGDVLSAAISRGKGKGKVRDDEPFVNVYLKDQLDAGNPLLSASKQRNGVQFQDGSPVKRTSDIDSPVFDPETGEVLITDDDIKHGLVNMDNESIHSGGAMKGAAGSLLGLLGKGAKGIKDKLSKGKKGDGKGLLGKGLGLVTDFYGTGFGLLKDAASKVYGKVRKPGMKDGSTATASDGMFERLDTIIELLEDIGGFDPRDNKRRRKRRKRRGGSRRRGSMRRGGRMARGGGSRMARGGARMARAGGGLLRGGARMAVSMGGRALAMGSTALGAASTMGSAAVGMASTAGAAVAGGASAVAGAAATALAAIPVAGWAVLGVAAVGAGAYYLWKKYKASKGSEALLDERKKLYGVLPGTDNKAIRKLENRTQEYLAGEEGPLDPRTLQKFAKKMGLDHKNDHHMSVFSTWFQERFIPMFGAYVKVIEGMGKTYDDMLKIDEDDEDFKPMKDAMLAAMKKVKVSDISLAAISEKPDDKKDSAEDGDEGTAPERKETKKEAARKEIAAAVTEGTVHKVPGDVASQRRFRQNAEDTLAGGLSTDVTLDYTDPATTPKLIEEYGQKQVEGLYSVVAAVNAVSETLREIFGEGEVFDGMREDFQVAAKRPPTVIRESTPAPAPAAPSAPQTVTLPPSQPVVPADRIPHTGA